MGNIEKKYKQYSVWVPSKDTGIDLLVTNKGINYQKKYLEKMISVQTVLIYAI